ncbi:MAG: hypothetical protein KKA90_04040 [Nanoarchaeota archaeon]|nr:hypothetical protein [Nanoarchaeota archaeon]
MARSVITITCPFCNHTKIEAYHHAPVKRYVGGPYGGGKNMVFVSEDKLIIASDCPNCGKSSSDIEKKMNEKKKEPHEERLKRIRDSGLPTNIES